MWISSVEDFEQKRDSVQIANPLTMQNNSRGLRGAMAGQRIQRADSAQYAANDVGVIVSLSGRRNVNQAQQTQSVSMIGIDMNLFAAD